MFFALGAGTITKLCLSKEHFLLHTNVVKLNLDLKRWNLIVHLNWFDGFFHLLSSLSAGRFLKVNKKTICSRSAVQIHVLKFTRLNCGQNIHVDLFLLCKQTHSKCVGTKWFHTEIWLKCGCYTKPQRWQNSQWWKKNIRRQEKGKKPSAACI